MIKKKNLDNQKENIQQAGLFRFRLFHLLYILLIFLSIILPLVFWQLKKLGTAPFVSFTRPEGLPFELFSGFISGTLVFITWSEIKKTRRKNLSTTLPIILGFFVSLVFLFNVAESTFDSRLRSDYIAFEKGAKAIINSINPYVHTESPYVYPPLVGQVMAFLYQIVIHIPFLSIDNEEQSWQVVFYFFQCSQLLLVILAYFLVYTMAQKLGFKPIPASLITAALFLFNNSVIRTFNFHQTNLWILDCFLIGILLQQKRPFISGFAVALGVHIKMYPLILILPWIAMRKWHLFIGASIGLLAIALIQTNLGQDWTLLKYFLDYLGNVSKPTPYRNNSINSVVYNFFKIPNVLIGTPFDSVGVIVTFITLVIAVWFLIRFIQRENIYRELNKSDSLGNQSYWSEQFRFYGHSMDAIALGLLISPSVYEHHYVVAIPVALWAIATRRLDKPVAVGFSIFLIFCIPTFDLFPFSFHRLVGLLMLVYFTAPESLQTHFVLQRKKRKMCMNSNVKNLE